VGGLLPEDEPVEPEQADRARIIFCEVVAIYGRSGSRFTTPGSPARSQHTLAVTVCLRFLGEPSLISAGVIMAIVFSAKINGDAVNIYSDNNYYSGE
jgi:hypothetical protein